MFSEDEVAEISDIIGLIYEAVIDETVWPRILERVCCHLGGAASRIYWRDASNGKGQTVYSWGIEPDFLQLYKDKYVTLNPLYPATIFIKPGEVFSSRELVPSPEFQASRFFKEWVAPQGFFDAAIFNIQRYQASAAAFTVITGRDYGLVDDRLRGRLKILAPHLQRAALISREIDTHRLHVQSLEAALDQVDAGVFILDAAGRAVWANHAAGALLARGDLVRSSAPGLSLSGPGADRLLREGLAAAPDQPEDFLRHRPALIRLTDREGGEWVACLMRLQPHSHAQTAFEQVERSAQAALFVRRADAVPASGIEAAASFYGLTPAEMRVLQAALDIDTVAGMATTLGVSANTVKKHLSAIFGKMGVSRRAGLIKAVLSAQR